MDIYYEHFHIEYVIKNKLRAGIVYTLNAYFLGALVYLDFQLISTSEYFSVYLWTKFSKTPYTESFTLFFGKPSTLLKKTTVVAAFSRVLRYISEM